MVHQVGNLYIVNSWGTVRKPLSLVWIDWPLDLSGLILTIHWYFSFVTVQQNTKFTFPVLHYKANKWINPFFPPVIPERQYSVRGFNIVNDRVNVTASLNKFYYIYLDSNRTLEKNCVGFLIFSSYISRRYKSLMTEIPLLFRQCIANHADTNSYGYLRPMAVRDESNPS